MTAALDAAPGPLDLVRRFINTVEMPMGPDELDSVQRAADWCRRYGLPAVGAGPQLERLRGFREALREVLYANNGEGDLAVAWESLRPFVTRVRLGLAVTSDRGLELRPAGESEDAVAALLAIVYEALMDGTWRRLRACRKASCRFAYYDRTKNASRAWCSMAACGNQEKAARRRRRTRAAPSP